MRIAFLGNDCNAGYRLCQWVRACGHDADLYVIPSELKHVRNDPAAFSVAAGAKLPEWVRRYDERGKYWFFRENESSRHIDANYDAVIATGEKGVLACNLVRRIPTFIAASGSDVTDVPLELFAARKSLRRRVVSWATRRAIRRCSRVLLAYGPSIATLRKIGAVDKLKLWSFPEDVERGRDRVNADLLRELNAKYAGYDRVFLWLSRLNLDATSADYKGPEKFLEAYRRIVQTGSHKVRAIIGSHGYDAAAFGAMARDWGLEPHIDWVEHLPFWSLITHLSMENAVVCDAIRADNIIAGLCREAMSVGAVVIRSYDREVTELTLGPGCPVMNVSSVDECHAAMAQTLTWEAARLKAESRRVEAWALEHLHYTAQLPRLFEIVREAIFVKRHTRGGVDGR